MVVEKGFWGEIGLEKNFEKQGLPLEDPFIDCLCDLGPLWGVIKPSRRPCRVMGTVSVHAVTGEVVEFNSGGPSHLSLSVHGRHDHSREAETEDTSTEGGDDGLDEELSGQVHERGRVVGVCPPYLSIMGHRGVMGQECACTILVINNCGGE